MNFIQFRTTKYWQYEQSPFVDNFDYSLLRLAPNERYLQSVNLGLDADQMTFKVVDCNDVEVNTQICVEQVGDNVYFDFVIYDEHYEEALFFVINDTYYSNGFVVTDVDKDYTSYIQYKDTINLCNCDDPEMFYKSVRLRVTEKDCEDADEFEQYYEVSTGNSRSSKAKQKTYKILELVGDKLINDAFKEVYNAQELYINGIRQSKVEPFTRGERESDSNWAVTDFKTDPLDIQISVPNVQACCFTIDAGINQVLPAGSTASNLAAIITDPFGLVNSVAWTELTSLGATIGLPNNAATNISALGAGTYRFQVCATSTEQVKCDEVTVTVLAPAEEGVLIEIAEADCSTNLILGWTNAYVVSMPIENGDVIYTDNMLTTPFDGNDNTYRAREGVVISDYSFDLSGVGVVSNKTTCGNQTGDGFAEIITQEQSNSCESCMTVRVNVADGGSEQVIITKTGISPYGVTIPCGSGLIVSADTNETITESKTYVLGLSGSNNVGGAFDTTTITLTVVGANTVSLSRDHKTPLQLC